MKRSIMTVLIFVLLVTIAVPAFADNHKPEKLFLGMVPSREASKLVNDLEPLAEILSEELEVMMLLL
ncbi:MAG: hypothetical protein ACLFUK_10405 [Halanaerobium sp.]